MRKIIVILLCAFGVAAPALAQSLAGDWIGQMNGGFKVRIHFERAGSGYTGKLINPSGNETLLDRVTTDGTHLHFAVSKLNLSYDGAWSDQDALWKGTLTFQHEYPLDLRRATVRDLGPTVHKRPQEDAVYAALHEGSVKSWAT